MRRCFAFAVFALAAAITWGTGFDSPPWLSPPQNSTTAVLTSINVKATGIAATDTVAVQAAFDKAALTGRPIALDATATQFAINTTIILKPAAGKTQFWLQAFAFNWQAPTFDYSGTGPCFKVMGVKNARLDGFRIRCLSANSVGFLVTTYGDYQSTSNITFEHCDVSTSAAGTRGWDVGPTDSGAADVSNIVWRNCTVTGDSGHWAGVGGFFVHGGNTLNLAWYDTNVAYQLGPGWSFWQDTNYSPSSGGGDSSSLVNCGGSYLYQAVRMQGGFRASVFGGRTEVSGTSGGGIFESGAGGGTNGCLSVYGHVSDALVSGASFGKAGNQTKVVVTNCNSSNTLISGYYLNGTSLN